MRRFSLLLDIVVSVMCLFCELLSLWGFVFRKKTLRREDGYTEFFVFFFLLDSFVDSCYFNNVQIYRYEN